MRYLPNDFPHYKTVNYYYNKWFDNGTSEKIILTQRITSKKSRNADPSGTIIDSQSVKGTPESVEDTGFDGGRLVKGRKRHIIVDTMGCLIVVCAHAANKFDGKAARLFIEKMFSTLDTAKKIWADGGYSGKDLCAWVKDQFKCDLEIVKKKKGVRVFVFCNAAGLSKELLLG